MKLFTERFHPWRYLLASIVVAIFASYINLMEYYCSSLFGGHHYPAHHTIMGWMTLIRLVWFTLTTWILFRVNLSPRNITTRKRIWKSLGIGTLSYLLYITFVFITHFRVELIGMVLPFQFAVLALITILWGYVQKAYAEQLRKEQELEVLRSENLESRYNALAGQVNPHFFFNSLGGLTALVRQDRKQDTIDYIDKLSSIFRYTLRSEKRGLVKLGEELNFVEAFRYTMEVRFANKLCFEINVPAEVYDATLPVLSLLPVIDNVVVHNIIDSDHRMTVSISLTIEGNLMISNPIYPKPSKPDSNGTGLRNLDNRFRLLTGKTIKIVSDDTTFSVILPLQ